MHLTGTVLSFLVLSILFSCETWGQANQKTKGKKRFLKGHSLKDPEDGAFDISEMLEGRGGFAPLPIIITEPAVGYGGGLVITYLRNNKSDSGENLPADATGLAGFGTQNGSWGVAAFHSNYINQDRMRYLGGLLKANMNLDFYFQDLQGEKRPLEVGLDAWGVLQRILFRVGKSNLFIGPEYVFFQTQNTLNDFDPDTDIDPDFDITEIAANVQGKSTLSLVGLLLDFDSRNSVYTPDTGISTGLSTRYSAEFLGSDRAFWLINPYFIGYVPVSKRIFSGYRFKSNFGTGDLPFYAKPFVQMRGVPAAKYQGDITMQVETEWRGFVYRRWSLVGFAGTGKAFDSFDEFNDADWVYSYGGGFRYLLARKNKMHVGIDFAWSNEDFAFYLIFGSFW